MRAAIITFLIFAMVAPVSRAERNRTRGLTRGERALLEPIFGDAVDYNAVQIIDAPLPLQPRDVYMTPRGHIHAPGWLYVADWSASQVSLRSRGELVHEMTHVWQHARGIDVVTESVRDFLRTRGNYNATYRYTLGPTKRLADYGIEQQASIVEDYFLYSTRGWPRGNLRAQYEAVLAQFP